MLLAATLGLATAVVAFTVYVGAVQNEFVWDDVIVLDQQLPYFDSIRSTFFPLPAIPQITNYYRPLIFVTYRIDESLADRLWPAAQHSQARRITYHLSCLVYHACVTLLVFVLGLTLYRAVDPTRADAFNAVGLAGAAAGAILFAVHPIHVESVAWMAGRSDLVCAVFLVGALILYLLHRRTGSTLQLLVAAVAALAAMFAKETGVAIVPLIVFIDLLLGSSQHGRRDKGVARFYRWGLFLGVTFLYLLIRQRALEQMSAPPLPAVAADGTELFGALGWYVAKIFWPPPQSAFVTGIPGGPYVLLGVLAASAWVAGTWWLWRRSEWTLELVAAALFFICLAPSLAIVVLRVSETPLAERYLYIPSIGICLAGGFLMERLATRLAPSARGRAAVAFALTLVVAVPAAWACVQRTTVWRNNFLFWQDAVRMAPNESLPHLHLGTAYAEMGDQEAAVEQYRRAVETARDSEARSKALNNLGSRYAAQGRYRDAIEQFKQATEEAPQYPMAHYNWGVAELSLAFKDPDEVARGKRITEGMQQLETALRLNPRYVEARLEYAHLLLNLGMREKGVEHLREVIRVAPASSAAQIARRSLAQAGAAEK